MEAYTGFAEVYDTFMDNVPYEKWAEYVVGLLKKYGIEDGLVLDLGCGTGSLTELLAAKGYDMTGVDFSEEMLEIAMEKKRQSGYDILYLLQDMREFELYGTMRAVVSICDSMNYLMSEEELEAFRNFPDELTVYRGVNQLSQKNVRAFSWTLSPEVAERFANRFQTDDRIIYRANINKKDVFAYFAGGEAEIIVNPSKLKKVTAL